MRTITQRAYKADASCGLLAIRRGIVSEAPQTSARSRSVRDAVHLRHNRSVNPKMFKYPSIKRVHSSDCIPSFDQMSTEVPRLDTCRDQAAEMGASVDQVNKSTEFDIALCSILTSLLEVIILQSDGKTWQHPFDRHWLRRRVICDLHQCGLRPLGRRQRHQH